MQSDQPKRVQKLTTVQRERGRITFVVAFNAQNHILSNCKTLIKTKPFFFGIIRFSKPTITYCRKTKRRFSDKLANIMLLSQISERWSYIVNIEIEVGGLLMEWVRNELMR